MNRYIDRPNQPGNLLIVCGFSGSGKSTLVRHALDVFSGNLQYMNTFTTRPRREGEDDIEYTFVDPAQYAHIKSEAAAWDESQIYGNYYGLDPSRYITELEQGQNVIVCGAPDVTVVNPMIHLYGSDVVSTIHVTTNKQVSAERLAARNIARDLSRVAADAIMLENGFEPDFIFDPSGDLARDKDKFTNLVEEIIYER